MGGEVPSAKKAMAGMLLPSTIVHRSMGWLAWVREALASITQVGPQGHLWCYHGRWGVMEGTRAVYGGVLVVACTHMGGEHA